MVGPVVEDGRGGIVEKQREANASGELLFGLAAGARLFRAADGRFHARVPVNGRHEILGLRSSAFRDWLIDGYRSAYQKLPPERAVQRVIECSKRALGSRSHTPPVYIRVGRGRDDDGSSIYLDLGRFQRAGGQIRRRGLVDRRTAGSRLPATAWALAIAGAQPRWLDRAVAAVCQPGRAGVSLCWSAGWRGAAAGGAVFGAGVQRRTRLGQEHPGQDRPAVDRPADGAAVGRAT